VRRAKSIDRRRGAAYFGLVISLAAAGCSGFTTSGGSPGKATLASISTQPANQTVTVGQTATFNVAATGTTPLSYQWQKGGTNISGAMGTSYTTPATTLADSGSKFDVVVTNPAGNVTSATATLTVNNAAAAPSITAQPSNQSVTVGQTATFSVAATGMAPLRYQWQKGGANISGATGTSYTTPGTTLADSGSKFSVVVTNTAGSATSNAATLTVSAAATAPSITIQPANQTVTAGQTATFSVVATGTTPLTYQWQLNGANISGATAASYTTPVTTTANSGQQFRVQVSNSVGSVLSTVATLTVNPATSVSSIDVITYHYDNLRTGQNVNEMTLTPANVNQATFGKLGEFAVDGLVDGQPLLLSNLTLPGTGNKNVLYVVTENDSIFAFDADSITSSGGTTLWHASALGSGETPSDNRGCGQVSPQIGITSTPVIDRSRNAIYVVAMSKDSNGNYHQRLHALNLTTGQELFGGPTTIQATFPGTGDNSLNGQVIFDPKQYKERPALLEVNGAIYLMWSSHCDDRPYTGWIMSYSADTLAQTSVLNLVPNGSEGAIWMSGAGAGADANGNIYTILGNGDFDTTLTAQGFPIQGDCGNCFAKISSTTPLTLIDYFTPLNTVSESDSDTDFGSGGPLLLPDLVDANGNTRHLAVGSGKDANIYVVDRDNMGKFNSNGDNIYQLITGQLAGGVWAKPSYFNGTVYYGAVNDSIKAFPITNAVLATSPSSRTSHTFTYPGAAPSISASGTSNGIVWVVENTSPAVLHAYDATNLTNELYNSNQAPNGRDQFSNNKFITPMVANGKVYVGTSQSVAVFGLL
jgi:Immunoglobulin I-set domain